MKKLKRFLRLCSLFLFLCLALAGMAVSGAAPTPPKRKDGRADIEISTEVIDKKATSKDESL